VGFLGSLSTFSTLMAELVITWQRRARGLALGLATASLLGGLLACKLGLVLGGSHP
jgi:CrcB protein